MADFGHLRAVYFEILNKINRLRFNYIKVNTIITNLEIIKTQVINQ